MGYSSTDSMTASISMIKKIIYQKLHSSNVYSPLASAIGVPGKKRLGNIRRSIPTDALPGPRSVFHDLVQGCFLGEVNISSLRPCVSVIALLRHRKHNGKDHRQSTADKYDERAIHSTRGAASRRHHRGAALAGCPDYAEGRTLFPRFCIKDVHCGVNLSLEQLVFQLER